MQQINPKVTSTGRIFKTNEKQAISKKLDEIKSATIEYGFNTGFNAGQFTEAGEAAINSLSHNVLLEMLTKLKKIDSSKLNELKQVPFRDIIARAVVIDSITKLPGNYDRTNNQCYLNSPWKVNQDIIDPDTNQPINHQGFAENAGFAYSLSCSDVPAGLEAVFAYSSHNNILDCSLAKQVINLNGLSESGQLKEENGPMVVQNESVLLNPTSEVQTVYDYMDEKFSEDTSLCQNVSKQLCQNVSKRVANRQQDDLKKNLYDSELLIPGDSVYFENHKDYPDGEAYLFSGQHAIYLGDGNYAGFGVEPRTAIAMCELLHSSFITDFTTARGTAPKEEDKTQGFPKLTEVYSFKPSLE